MRAETTITKIAKELGDSKYPFSVKLTQFLRNTNEIVRFHGSALVYVVQAGRLNKHPALQFCRRLPRIHPFD